MLTNLVIDHFLTRNSVTKPYYQGCYPANKLPDSLQHPHSMVVNFDSASKPGTHWVALFSPFKGHVDYFDSYGGDGVTTINRHLRKCYLTCTRALASIQNDSSQVCGYYCMFFIYMRSMGVKMHKVEQYLKTQPNPDNYVVKFCVRNIMVAPSATK